MNPQTTRSLSADTLQAALHAHHLPALADIAQIPTVAASHKQYNLPLVCQYSGTSCGQLILPTVAGYLPLLSQWKQQQVLHPLFSLEPIALLNFAKNTWIRFCGFSQEEAENTELTSKQEKMLQIAALAMIHHLTEVRQDIPWLPDFVEVQNNWQSLISLSYWKAYLDSQRFQFPSIRISKLEQSINLHAFLQTCWDAKKRYESTVNERIEQEKGKLAEKALLAIRNELAGKRPISTKLLWRWFLANLPKRYAKDADQWMWDLFTAKDKTIFDFTMADIDLFEEIFLCECPTGSSVSHAFLQVLRSKRKLLETHFETFEILVPTALQADADSGAIPETEPKLADFPKRTLYLIAYSKWKLTHGKSTVHRDAATAKQLLPTVRPSLRPKLDLPTFDEQDEFDTDIGYVSPDSVAATQQADSITGELEE